MIYDRREPLHEVKLRTPGAKARAQRRFGGTDKRGEFDWFYDLPVSRRRSVARWHMTANGLGIEDLATTLDCSIDEAAAQWLEAIDFHARASSILDDFDNQAADDSSDILGPHEVAELVGVRLNTIAQWRHRGTGPVPDRVIGMGPLWFRSTVESWFAERTAEDPLLESVPA